MVAVYSASNAQTIQHTTWKSFFDAPINDTATLSIGSDTLTITSSRGVMDVALIHIVKDTIDINDVAGPIKCMPDDKGIYHITFTNGRLVLNVISDPCDGRNGALSGKEWMMVKK